MMVWKFMLEGDLYWVADAVLFRCRVTVICVGAGNRGLIFNRRSPIR